MKSIENNFINTTKPEQSSRCSQQSSQRSSVGSWKIFHRPGNYQELSESLDNLPSHWSLTPLREKRPYRPNWQTETKLERQLIRSLVKDGEQAVSKKTGKPYTAYISGVGLRTGEHSDGLVALDLDGASAEPLLQAISNGELPPTVSWTSGRPGRKQLLFQVTDSYREKLTNFTRSVITEYEGIKTSTDELGKPTELLEFRYNKCQSVLPPSLHPQTGKYYWLNSPEDTEVAIAPPWLCDLLVSLATDEQIKTKQRSQAAEERARLAERRRQKRALNQLKGHTTLEDCLEESIARLGTDIYNWKGHNFVERGSRLEGCCPNHQSVSGRSFHVNLNTWEWYCFGCGLGGHAVEYRQFVNTGTIQARGKDFVDIVRELAADAGVEFPEPNRSEFIARLLAKAKNLSKHFHKGFGQYCHPNVAVYLPKTIKYDPKTPLPTPSDYEGKQPPRIKFSKGQRHEVIAKLRSLGWQFVLDRSFMGTGKSHDLGLFANSNGQTWYLDLNHRNPTTETVERNFNDLPVRHNGLNHDPLRTTPLGNPHLHWAGEGDKDPDVLSLCHNAHLFLKLQNKGYPLDSLKDFQDDSTLNPICKSCKFHKCKVDGDNGEKVAICAAQKGEGYGFRFARREGLSHNQIRASIDSLPNSEDYDFSQDIAIVDEASRLIRGTKKVTASLKDFSTKMVELEQFPELFSLLKPLRETLIPLLSGQENLALYGLNHQQIIDLLPSPPEELEEIIKAAASLNPSWQDLSVSPERVTGWGKDWKASIATANWYLQKEAQEMTLENIDNLASNFLLDLLMIWARLTPGTIRIDSRRHLIVTTKEPRHGELLRAMSQVILLDATGNKELLAKRLGVGSDELIEIEQELPQLDNLTVVNVQMSGMSSNQWSSNCIQRNESLINYFKAQHPEIPILGIKRYGEALQLDGWWFNDNRGSNAFKSQSAIAALGTPQINVGSVQDEYLTLYGSLDGFEDYYQSLIDSEVTQLVGRQRAHLYPSQQFVIYLVGTGLQIDYLEKLGINIVSRHAFELTSEAGTSKQVSQYKIVQAVPRILQAGRTKITLDSLAAETGLSRDYIKKLVAGLGGMMAFKKWVLSLYKSYRSSTRFFAPDLLLADAKIREWMRLEPIAATKEILKELKNHGWRDFQEYLNNFSIDIQAEIWAAIAPWFLPEIAYTLGYGAPSRERDEGGWI